MVTSTSAPRILGTLCFKEAETVYYSKDPEVRFRKRGERAVVLKLLGDDL